MHHQEKDPHEDVEIAEQTKSGNNPLDISQETEIGDLIQAQGSGPLRALPEDHELFRPANFAQRIGISLVSAMSSTEKRLEMDQQRSRETSLCTFDDRDLCRVQHVLYLDLFTALIIRLWELLLNGWPSGKDFKGELMVTIFRVMVITLPLVCSYCRPNRASLTVLSIYKYYRLCFQIIFGLAIIAITVLMACLLLFTKKQTKDGLINYNVSILSALMTCLMITFSTLIHLFSHRLYVRDLNERWISLRHL